MGFPAIRPGYALLAMVSLVGCFFDPIDLSNRSCDCAVGWVCDEIRNVCVERSAQDGAAGRDGGRDAGRDARGTDAGPGLDATGTDAGTELDSGLTDGGSSDAGSDSGPIEDGSGAVDSGAPPPFACSDYPGAILCEDFEAPFSGRWNPIESSPSVLVVRDTTEAFTGTGSLHAETYSEGSIASLKRTITVPGSPVYMRLQFRTNLAAGSFQFARLGEAGSPFGGAGLTIGEDAFEAFFIGQPGRVRVTAGLIDGWNCVEAEIVTHASRGSMTIYLNGSPAGSLAGINTVTAGGINSATVGVVSMQPGTSSSNVHVDDVLVTSERVPCLRP